MTENRAKVVIIGGGFGGLEAAKALRRTSADVTVIDRQNHHCFQPLLYQVATAALSPAEIAWPIRSILRSQRNVTVLMEEISGIDPQRKLVKTNFGETAYDYLIVATGTMHSYFGHDEWAPFAPGLKSIEDATRIRRSILIAFERAEVMSDAAEQRRLLTFAVVGGGATGVEMAGAIAEIARQTLAKDFRRIDPRNARIVLIEAGPRVLSTFPPEQSDYVRATLMTAGVTVMTDTMVTKCDERGVDLNSGRLDAGTIIWAAGVTASPAARWLGVGADRAGRVKVNADLSVPGHPDIYAVGDTAALPPGEGKPVPNMAPAAKQMGRHAAKLIDRRIAGQSADQPFRYTSVGEIATIGRSAAVYNYGRIRLYGFIGWLSWGAIHIYFLIGLRNRFVVALAWLWNYVTFERGARLITEPDRASEP
ncbi:MAG: NAD(P)/FAD-dependent oxidoreductase [Pseudolabrys sp.]|nr:NAD(P)/FAD-dependent oxidoreductase [Pseudolabrys sp.]